MNKKKRDNNNYSQVNQTLLQYKYFTPTQCAIKIYIELKTYSSSFIMKVGIVLVLQTRAQSISLTHSLTQ